MFHAHARNAEQAWRRVPLSGTQLAHPYWRFAARYADPFANCQTYDRLNATFHSFKTLPIEYRLYNLKQLAFLIQDNIEAIYAALHKDLSKEPFDIDVGDVSNPRPQSGQPGGRCAFVTFLAPELAPRTGYRTAKLDQL